MICFKMEDSGGDFAFLDEDLSISQVVLIQSLVRGWLARKWLSRLQTEFEEIFTEIEKKPMLEIVWKNSTICCPKVTRLKKQKIRNSVSKERTRHQSVDAGQDSTFKTEHKPNVNLNYGDTLIERECTFKGQEMEILDEKILPDSVTDAVHDFDTRSVGSDTRYVGSARSLKSCHTDTGVKVNDVGLFHGDISSHVSNQVKAQVTYSTAETQTQTHVIPDPSSRRSSASVQTQESEKLGSQDWEQGKCDGTKETEFHHSLQSLENDVATPEFSQTQQSIEVRRMKHSERPYTSDMDEESGKSKDSRCSNKSSPVSCVRAVSPQFLVTEQPHILLKTDREKDSFQPDESENERNRVSSAFTNVTSVWDSFNSLRESLSEPQVEQKEMLPRDSEKLKELRRNIAMELLWVQQAITSRKNYLRLRQKHDM